MSSGKAQSHYTVTVTFWEASTLPGTAKGFGTNSAPRQARYDTVQRDYLHRHPPLSSLLPSFLLSLVSVYFSLCIFLCFLPSFPFLLPSFLSTYLSFTSPHLAQGLLATSLKLSYVLVSGSAPGEPEVKHGERQGCPVVTTSRQCGGPALLNLCICVSCTVMPDSMQPQGLYPPG